MADRVVDTFKNAQFALSQTWELHYGERGVHDATLVCRSVFLWTIRRNKVVPLAKLYPGYGYKGVPIADLAVLMTVAACGGVGWIYEATTGNADRAWSCRSMFVVTLAMSLVAAYFAGPQFVIVGRPYVYIRYTRRNLAEAERFVTSVVARVNDCRRALASATGPIPPSGPAAPGSSPPTATPT